MAVFPKPQHLTRYRDIARLFIKYGRGDLIANSGLEDVAPESPAAAPTNGAAGGAPDPDAPAETLAGAPREEKREKDRALADDLERIIVVNDMRAEKDRVRVHATQRGGDTELAD